MINYSSDISALTKMLEDVKTLIDNTDQIILTVAEALLPELRVRVHRDGKDSNGALIGTYSAGYMKVRTGNYKDAATFKRGEKKGQYKEEKASGDAGNFSKGKYRGANRPTYNRFSADTKVILTLTRQMENDLHVLPTTGGYGLGYLNPLNYQKAIWAENPYKKKILTKLTTEERQLAVRIVKDSLPESFKSKK